MGGQASLDLFRQSRQLAGQQGLLLAMQVQSPAVLLLGARPSAGLLPLGRELPVDARRVAA